MSPAKNLHKIPSSLGSTCAFVQESVALLHSLSGWTKFLHLSHLNGSSNLALDSILLRIDVCFGEGSAITVHVQRWVPVTKKCKIAITRGCDAHTRPDISYNFNLAYEEITLT